MSALTGGETWAMAGRTPAAMSVRRPKANLESLSKDGMLADLEVDS